MIQTIAFNIPYGLGFIALCQNDGFDISTAIKDAIYAHTQGESRTIDIPKGADKYTDLAPCSISIYLNPGIERDHKIIDCIYQFKKGLRAAAIREIFRAQLKSPMLYPYFTGSNYGFATSVSARHNDSKRSGIVRPALKSEKNRQTIVKVSFNHKEDLPLCILCLDKNFQMGMKLKSAFTAYVRHDRTFKIEIPEYDFEKPMTVESCSAHFALNPSTDSDLIEMYNMLRPGTKNGALKEIFRFYMEHVMLDPYYSVFTLNVKKKEGKRNPGRKAGAGPERTLDTKKKTAPETQTAMYETAPPARETAMPDTLPKNRPDETEYDDGLGGIGDIMDQLFAF